MSIVRAPRPASGFTILANGVVRDHRLSYRARGVLAYVLSMPDHWATSSVHLARVASEGRDAIRTALRELETAGYLKRYKQQNERGHWQTVTVVYDSPSLCETLWKGGEFVHTPTPEKPTPDNQALIENQLVKTESSSSSESYSKRCNACGGTVSFDPDVLADTCYDCGAPGA